MGINSVTPDLAPIQINLSTMYLKISRNEVEKIKRLHGNGGSYEWGDRFVSRAIQLGSKFVIENIGQFPLGSKRNAVLGSMLQAIALNQANLRDAEDTILDTVNYISKYSDTSAIVMDFLKNKAPVISPTGHIDERQLSETEVNVQVNGRSYDERYVTIRIGEDDPFEFKYYVPVD